MDRALPWNCVLVDLVGGVDLLSRPGSPWIELLSVAQLGSQRQRGSAQQLDFLQRFLVHVTRPRNVLSRSPILC